MTPSTTTNREYYGNKPLEEALGKYAEDQDHGYDYPFWDWLDCRFMDFTKGMFVRGDYYTYEDAEACLRKLDSLEVTGYLLEYLGDDDKWKGSEFVPEQGGGGNLWGLDYMETARRDWEKSDTQVGYFKELPDVWFSEAEDWDYRLGVDFHPSYTPKERPSPISVWGGVSTIDGGLWRVRKITIKGELSNKAKEFFRRNPDVRFEYATRIY